VDLQRKYKEIRCYEESDNGNQKEHIREETKKEEWMDGVRRRKNKHGLIKKDAKETFKSFGRRKTPYRGHYLNE
jgi:hypothetical protein